MPTDTILFLPILIVYQEPLRCNCQEFTFSYFMELIRLLLVNDNLRKRHLYAKAPIIPCYFIYAHSL